MRSHLLGILVLLKYCICSDVHNFDGDIRNLVVGKSKLFVLTDRRLYQMTHDLSEEKIKDISNDTHPNTVTLLVPFDVNRTLITCGTSNYGYCEVLDEDDITNSIYWESISVGPLSNGTSVAFIVDTKPKESPEGTYLLVGRKNRDFITLRDTLDSKYGIFSQTADGSDAYIQTTTDVKFVDGFQTISCSFSYIFLNANTESGWKAHVLRLDNTRRKKRDIIRSLKGTLIECCSDKPRPVLVSSSVISSDEAVIWAGVFSAQDEKDPENTALAVYDISKVEGRVKDFCSNINPDCNSESGKFRVQPLAVVFKYSSMSSVAAVRDGPWVVLFTGTKDGQLIKFVLDEAFRSGCPTVLYRSDDERAVFPRMHFDPVDSKHIYIALKKQIRRVSVAQCGTYRTLKDCTAALDPFCGWCVNTHRCSIKDECLKSLWVSIPEDSLQKQLLSFQVAEKSPKEISLTLALSLESTGNPTFSCVFTTESVNLCDSSDPAVVFPNCFCNFSEQRLSGTGLTVSATVTIEDQKITETLTLRNCPDITNNSRNASYEQCVQCISSGCGWSSEHQRCDWTRGPGQQIHIQDVCKDLRSELDYREPEILSLEPNKVSFHGRNRVLLTGRNLESVTKIRIQGNLDCVPKESPVLEHSSGSLRFNIPPSGTKERVKVCVVTSDGRCHGNSIIIYSSQPSCSKIQPKVTWNSGGRKIHVQGDNMEFVELIIYSSNIELKTQYNTSSGGLWFHSPPHDVSGVFSLAMKVADTTIDCVDDFSFLPDPEFTGFTTSQVNNDLLVIIQKKADRLNLILSEVRVTGVQGDQEYECILEMIEINAILCKIKGEAGVTITLDSLTIRVGTVLIFRIGQSSTKYMFCLSPQNPI